MGSRCAVGVVGVLDFGGTVVSEDQAGLVGTSQKAMPSESRRLTGA